MSRGTIGDQLRSAGFQEKAAKPRGATDPGKTPTAIVAGDQRKPVNATHQDNPPPNPKIPDKARPPVAITPDEEIAQARARAEGAERQLRAALFAVDEAKREASRSQQELHNLLVRHGRIAEKPPRKRKGPLTFIPEEPRKGKQIPSHGATGPLVGMTVKPPAVDKAVREAAKAMQDGYVHMESPRRARQEPKKK